MEQHRPLLQEKQSKLTKSTTKQDQHSFTVSLDQKQEEQHKTCKESLCHLSSIASILERTNFGSNETQRARNADFIYY